MNGIEVEGFTPAPDSLLVKHGPITALVYGKVWRYWIAYGGKAGISQKRLAEELGINDRTLRNHLKKLLGEKYIKQRGEIGKVQQYIPTDKIRFRFAAEETRTPESDSDPLPEPRNQIPTTPELDSDKESIKESINTESATSVADSPPKNQNAVRAEFEKEFAMFTGLPLPARRTAAQKKSAAALWWNPIREMLGLFEWDQERAARVMGIAIQQMRTDCLTISSPKSILNVVKDLYAREKSGADISINGRHRQSKQEKSIANLQAVISETEVDQHEDR